MLKVRENVPEPTPEPLGQAAVALLFRRIRRELRLPEADAGLTPPPANDLPRSYHADSAS